LANWLVVDRVAILTGFLGQAKNFVEKVCIDAKASDTQPMYQGVKCKLSEILRSGDAALPTWRRSTPNLADWLVVGARVLRTPNQLHSFRVLQPDSHTVVPDYMSTGYDIMKEMISWENILFGLSVRDRRYTSGTSQRSSWFGLAFQTCMWLGTSTLSKNLMANAKAKAKAWAKATA
jgi:hypothetical protein